MNTHPPRDGKKMKNEDANKHPLASFGAVFAKKKNCVSRKKKEANFFHKHMRVRALTVKPV